MSLQMRLMVELSLPIKSFASLSIKVMPSAMIEPGINKTLQKDTLKLDKAVQLHTAISSSLEMFLLITETVESIFFKVSKIH